MTPQTQWIGGSYEAACGYTPPTPTTAQRLLDAIKTLPGATVGDITTMTRLNYSTVKNSVARMEKRGEIHKRMSTMYLQRGTTRVAHWYAAGHGAS